MSFTVVGPGLVGSFLGATGGADRAVCGRSRRPKGVRVRLPADPGTWVDWRPLLVKELGDGPVLVCTRVPDTPWLELPEDVLLAQNGLGQPRPCAACFFAVDRDDQDLVGAVGPAPRLVLEDPGPAWAPVLARWREAGIGVELVQDVAPARWEKCILNATVGPLCLATGRTMGQVWGDAELRTLTRVATREGVELAAAEGVRCDGHFVEAADAFFAACDGHVPSVVTDPGELPWVLGALLDRADAHGRECPALRRIAALVERAKGGTVSTRLPAVP